MESNFQRAKAQFSDIFPTDLNPSAEALVNALVDDLMDAARSPTADLRRSVLETNEGHLVEQRQQIAAQALVSTIARTEARIGNTILREERQQLLNAITCILTIKLQDAATKKILAQCLTDGQSAQRLLDQVVYSNILVTAIFQEAMNSARNQSIQTTYVIRWIGLLGGAQAAMIRVLEWYRLLHTPTSTTDAPCYTSPSRLKDSSSSSPKGSVSNSVSPTRKRVRLQSGEYEAITNAMNISLQSATTRITTEVTQTVSALLANLPVAAAQPTVVPAGQPAKAAEKPLAPSEPKDVYNQDTTFQITNHSASIVKNVENDLNSLMTREFGPFALDPEIRYSRNQRDRINCTITINKLHRMQWITSVVTILFANGTRDFGVEPEVAKGQDEEVKTTADGQTVRPPADGMQDQADTEMANKEQRPTPNETHSGDEGEAVTLEEAIKMASQWTSSKLRNSASIAVGHLFYGDQLWSTFGSQRARRERQSNDKKDAADKRSNRKSGSSPAVPKDQNQSEDKPKPDVGSQNRNPRNSGEVIQPRGRGGSRGGRGRGSGRSPAKSGGAAAKKSNTK